MTGGGSPIWGEAVRRGLTADEIAAGGQEVREEQANLNEQELMELERTEYYGEPVAVPAQPARGGIMARLRAIFSSGG